MRRLLLRAKPTWVKGLLFISFAFLMPVPHLRREPLYAFTNAYWAWRYDVHESLFTVVAGGYGSSLNVFLGILVRDYFRNTIGVPLLLLYYVASCLICTWLARLWRYPGLGDAAQRSSPFTMRGRDRIERASRRDGRR